MQRNLFFILLVNMMVLLTACNLINPDENAPGFIQVDSITFDPTATSGTTGNSTSSNIKDVWVYINNEFQGVYELPAKFPVLKTGATNIILSPGIFLNGIAATRTPYPFYQGSIQDIVIPELGTVSLNPVVSYFDSVKCSYKEDFEGSGFSLTSTSLSDTVMYQTIAGDTNNFEGFCGVAVLETENTVFEVTTTTSYDLPGSGAAVFLEFDYKVNQVLTAGIFIENGTSNPEQIAIVNLNPTEIWKKIYVQLGYTVSAYPNATGYKIFFGAAKNPAIEKSIFYLDNIKVVHF